MGTRIIVADADFSSNAIGYNAPAPAGLEYLNFFGGDADQVRRNLARGKPAGQIVGSPTINEHSIVCTSMSAFVQTMVAHVEAMSFFVVARQTDPESENLIISNYMSPRVGGGGNTIGSSLMYRKQSAVDGIGMAALLMAHFDGGSGTSTLAEAIVYGLPVGAVRALSGQFDGATRTSTVRNETGVASGNGSWASPNVLDRGGAFRIGSGYQSLGGTQPCEIFHVAAWSRIITADERAAHYARIKAYYAERGISI